MTLAAGFWLQYAVAGAEDLVALAEELALDGSRPGVVFAPVGGPARLRSLYADARTAGDAFLDPSGFLLDRPESPQRRRNFPWLEQAYGRPVGVAGWTRWMEASLEHQLSGDLRGGAAVPTALITPSPQLYAAAGTGDLYEVLDAARAARDSTAGDHECWLSVVVDRDFLRLEARLTELANAVVTAGFPGVVFRCVQAELPPVGDHRLLEGLREVAEGCAGAEIGLFMPNAGWLGWLAMAWGATGFSGGLSKGSWFDRMRTPMTNPGRRDKIFEPQLIRDVPWTLHEELASDEDAYEPCECGSCDAMGGEFEANEAQIHQIRTAHVWSDALRPLNAVGRRRAIRDRLDEAIEFRDNLARLRRGRAEAGFLDTWRALA